MTQEPAKNRRAKISSHTKNVYKYKLESRRYILSEHFSCFCTVNEKKHGKKEAVEISLRIATCVDWHFLMELKLQCKASQKYTGSSRKY